MVTFNTECYFCSPFSVPQMNPVFTQGSVQRGAAVGMSKIGGNLLTLWKWGEVRKCRLENYSHTGSFPLDYKPINCKASFVIGF